MPMRVPVRGVLFHSLLLSSLLVFSGGQPSVATGRRAWVGIDIADEIATAQLHKLPTALGVSVLSVDEDSPASSAGLMRGDVIVKVDGEPVANTEELICAIMTRLPGSVVRLATIRGTGSLTVLVTLGNWPDALLLPPRHCPSAVARTSFNRRVGVAMQ